MLSGTPLTTLTIIVNADHNPRMLNPVWLNTFATVAASHSFTDAGRQLGLTQSSVSEHIRRLEESVGRRLLIRDTHSLALTADGEAMLVHARVILEAMAHAESQFRSPRLRGRVRLGSSDDLALGPLPSVLAAFRNTHPDVELEITIGMTGQLYQLLDADRQIDRARGKAPEPSGGNAAATAAEQRPARRVGRRERRPVRRRPGAHILSAIASFARRGVEFMLFRYGFERRERE